mmetsp:Transcript_17232/g.46645  ORF Transcript_17232/g.46645 Transcript_17232/m.46645 type:complete len:100 (+) Transcript_17232:616-915(+)
MRCAAHLRRLSSSYEAKVTTTLCRNCGAVVKMKVRKMSSTVLVNLEQGDRHLEVSQYVPTDKEVAPSTVCRPQPAPSAQMSPPHSHVASSNEVSDPPQS